MFGSLFGFMDMQGTYDSRKVARYEDGDIIISTAKVTDGSRLYETAVAHPEYNDGKFVIVESYDTREEAKTRHDSWVTRMTSPELPASLVDCENSEIQQLASGLGDKPTLPRQTK